MFISCFVCSLSLASDSIYSIYRAGEFSTQYQSSGNASKEVVSIVADNLYSDFCNSPGHLFSWAMKDLGLQNKNNEVIIVFKSSTYNPKTGIIHGIFDIDVPHFTTFKNIVVDAHVTKTRYTSGAIKLTTEIVYSSMLMKKAIGSITLIPQKNNNVLAVAKADISFGWFFNLFLTQKRYKSIVEWRIKKFADNVVDECEHQQRMELKK